MKDTKYAYASEDPHESPSFFAFGSHGLPLRHASIIFGHDSPVAHLEYFEIIHDIKISSRKNRTQVFTTFKVSMKNISHKFYSLISSKLSFKT